MKPYKYDFKPTLSKEEFEELSPLKTHVVSPNMMLTVIELALGITLTEGQKNYIMSDGEYWFGGRQTGKTTAYCIKLALSDGPPLDLEHPEKWCDSDSGSVGNSIYYGKWFRGQFMDIWTRLKDFGIKVRDLKEDD